jgi:hypothetical protein
VKGSGWAETALRYGSFVMEKIMVEPMEEYSGRLAQRRHALERWQRLDSRLSLLRLLVFASLVVLGIVQFMSEERPVGSWLVAFGIAFLLLLIWHSVVRRRIGVLRGSVEFYEKGLARLQEEWAGTACSGDEYRPEHHCYADDLDIFGHGSLFERLCGARTKGGESTLAAWLLAPASKEVVVERQAAVRELTANLDLREELFRLAGAVRVECSLERMNSWASAPPTVVRPVVRVIAPLLVCVTVGALLGASRGWFGGAWLVVSACAQMVLAWHVRLASKQVSKAGILAPELGVLAAMLERLVAVEVGSPLLVRLKAQITAPGGHSPGALVRGLSWRLDMLEASRNQLFAIFSPLLLWGSQWAMAVEAWRVRHGRQLCQWFEAAGEFEALLSLASYAYEHPDDVFPEFVPGPATVEGRKLGHPLLPAGTCVRNDVALSAGTPLLIVSGSNMSGKSTFLRTLGCAVVMAMAGAPVRAQAFRLSPLAVGASIRVSDSLRAGTSKFYAEIGRLRDISEGASANRPTLFLLDEILHGTNSQDRLVGARGVLELLLGRGGIGIVTTHDLALTALVDGIPGARNVHFADEISGQKMVFDYQMKDGVVARSNALLLMKSLGLPV